MIMGLFSKGSIFDDIPKGMGKDSMEKVVDEKIKKIKDDKLMDEISDFSESKLIGDEEVYFARNLIQEAIDRLASKILDELEELIKKGKKEEFVKKAVLSYNLIILTIKLAKRVSERESSGFRNFQDKLAKIAKGMKLPDQADEALGWVEQVLPSLEKQNYNNINKLSKMLPSLSYMIKKAASA